MVITLTSFLKEMSNSVRFCTIIQQMDKNIKYVVIQTIQRDSILRKLAKIHSESDLLKATPHI